MAHASRLFQWLFVFSCFIFLGVQANDSVVTFKDWDGEMVNLKYDAVGCYKDSASRSLRNFYFDARNLKPDYTQIIRACSKNAYENSFGNMFGIQNYGECWSDGSVESRYDKYGKSSNCEHGVGKDWANMVYRLSVIPKSVGQTCNINGKEYNEGDEMSIPNDWANNVNNAKCMKCTCTGGEAEDCKEHAYCDTGRQGLCSKWRNAAGECCPVCACYNDGKVMDIGSTWVVRDGLQCSECTCGANKIATCTGQQTYTCGGEQYEMIPQPEKCSPKCVPKTTTSPPTEIILPETERPPLTFPNFARML